MTNKKGIILGIVSAILYVLLSNGFGSLTNFFIDIIAASIIPLIISGLITIFRKNNFGKIFGISSIVIQILSLIGNFMMR
ncbi:hypothetical protein [Tenacibaculum piscium]|uniref:hypothetical protein n=1 Tax=Tenacibaculum piscium TaxID=1458515 RepID=UPI00187B75F8|nr:hypothetical protein [Tenacibaculum piscium]